MAFEQDRSFLVHQVLDYAGHYASLDLADAPGRELIDAIVDEVGRFALQELQPLNSVGDQQGCTFADGTVTTPPGFKEAYRKFVEGGWASLTGAVEYGGQGLPDSMSLFLEELLCAENLAWAMYPGLSRGVLEALESHGSPEQKQKFLTKLISGEWTGTMCLTEPHAGSDVGLARTRAVADADGTYRITGTKIFISAGEHDLAENIVHLVLARVAGAPEGTQGISMFVVPKFDLDGTRNQVVCGAIEEKMGIHGNATCVLHFEEAIGYLVGDENDGMRYMFTMMNAARIVVGLQAVSLAQSAYEKSATYATERLQMRSLSGPRAPDKPADPIIVHPDVRRMLLTQKALIEGGRALVYFAGQLIDVVELGKDAEVRDEASELLDFLTPIVKGFLTEVSFEAINHGVQVFGGHGYIRETGVEQLVRDARITMLYEGTTGIQALDLLGRKVLMTQGKGLIALLGRMNATADACKSALPDIAEALTRLGEQWSELSFAIGAKAQDDAEEIGAASVDYLFYSGYAVLAYLWARMALTASELADDAYAQGKIATARFYFQRLLPRTLAHKAAIEAGGASLIQISDEALTSGLGTPTGSATS